MCTTVGAALWQAAGQLPPRDITQQRRPCFVGGFPGQMGDDSSASRAPQPSSGPPLEVLAWEIVTLVDRRVEQVLKDLAAPRRFGERRQPHSLRDDQLLDRRCRTLSALFQDPEDLREHATSATGVLLKRAYHSASTCPLAAERVEQLKKLFDDWKVCTSWVQSDSSSGRDAWSVW